MGLGGEKVHQGTVVVGDGGSRTKGVQMQDEGELVLEDLIEAKLSGADGFEVCLDHVAEVWFLVFVRG